MTVPEIDMTDPFAELPAAEAIADEPMGLLGLIYEEGKLDSLGVTCELKEKAWARPACMECPVRGRAPMSRLCEVGVAQQRAIVEMAGAHAGGGVAGA